MSLGLPKARVYGQKAPPLVPRSPLGPFPQPITYDSVLPFVPPPMDDIRFYRGNFCGIRIPGAPVVPGCNALYPDLVMSCLLDNYPQAIQEAYLLKYAQNGFKHLQRSFGHALHYGSTLDQFIALSKRAQSYGLFADQWLIGVQESQPKNQDVTYWKPVLDPILDRFIGEGVIDTSCVGWQLDHFYDGVAGNPLISVIAYVADKLPQSVPLTTHWVNEALAWWKDGGEQWSDKYQSIWIADRFSWWYAMRWYLSGGHHQGNTTMARIDPKLYQDKMKDTLDPFCGDKSKGDMGQSQRGGVRDFTMDVTECTAQDQFSDGANQFVLTDPKKAPYPGCPLGTLVGAPCSEDEGDMIGFLLACTTSFNGKGMSGFYNGARMPDGTAL